jgi:gas vesicle protein
MNHAVNKLVSFAAGLLLGGLLGAAAAILATPKSGKQLQDEIRQEVELVMEEGRKAAEVRRQELEKKLAEMRGDLPLAQ